MSIHNSKSEFYNVEIATSHDNKLYDEKLLDYLAKKYHSMDWKDMTETMADKIKPTITS